MQELNLGKAVVTANKALISAHGEALFEAVHASGSNLYYEATVRGGISNFGALREGMGGNRISRLSVVKAPPRMIRAESFE